MNRKTTSTKGTRKTAKPARKAPAKKAAAERKPPNMSQLRRLVGKRGEISADKARQIREIIG